jgi:uncharacterized protein YjdB
MFKMYAKLIVQKVSSIGLAIKSNQAKARLKISLSIMALSMFLSLGSSSLFAQTGGALKFDGVGDKVNIANTSALDFSTGTVEAWVKPGASSNNQGFVMMRPSVGSTRWSAHINQSGSSIGIFDGSTYNPVSVGTITANTWYHVALVFNSGNTAVYVNGVLKGSTGNGINAGVTGNPFTLGNNDAGYANEDFLGEMDEVRIWSTARTTAQILANKDAIITSSALGLIANYHFNQGLAAGANSAVTTLTDASGNSNTGTLVNFALTGAASNWVASTALSCAPIVSPILGLSAVCAGETITLQNNTLNTTSQAMMIGYSLRKLLGQYSGNAVRVRRSSDNTEANIGFTAAGDFDEAALKTFAGSGNAFVTIWYDQSGSAKNMVQTNTGYQPQILFSGNLKYIGSRPTLDFKDNKGLVYPTTTKMASASVVIKSESTNWPSYHAILDGGGRIGGLLQAGGTDFHGNQYGTALWKNGTSIAVNASLSPTNESMVVSFTSQRASPNVDVGGLCIGNYDLGGGGGSILQTEAIAFATTASSADRQTVEVNQGSYYGITSVVGSNSGTGLWSSDNTAIALVNSTTGIVTGKSQGTVNINYSFTNSYGCTSTVTKNITVNVGPTIAAVAGPSIVCANSTITLTNATPSGVWSSSDTQKATVNASTGVVTGMSAGVVVITYTVTSGAGCPSLANYNVEVKATAAITADVPLISDMQVLLVAGGGGGGSDMGGGGGGGGVISQTIAINSSATPYPITIGAGGSGSPAGTSQVRGSNGVNTTFIGLVAIGGGGGASTHNNNNSPASIGGSGGGASGGGTPAGGNGGAPAAGTAGQGFAGADGKGTWYPGGGGGAGGVGFSQPATGGPGIQYPALSSYFWGGGGGGSGYDGIGGDGGIGGGGGGARGVTTGGLGLNNGSPGGGGDGGQTNKPGGNAGANTGGGGGGGSHFNSNNKGGDGGSGIVIIKYSGTPRATGGTITQSGGFTTHTFTTVGSSNFTVTSSGTGGVCLGASKTLANATPNGVWSSSDATIASIASDGVVTGIKLGSCVITYSVTEPTTNCVYSTNINFIVANPPTITAVSSGVTCAGAPAIITATPSVASGSIIRWYDAPTGGNLLYTGATFTTPVYTANVSYYVEVNNYGCSSVRTEVPVTKVLPTTGTQTLCVKSTVTLSNATSGNNGTWTTSNANIATVNATTGVVTGLSGGNVVITYTVPTGTACPATYNLTVAAVAPTKGNGVSIPFQVLLVAGGGGGGSNMGGGGGGGGVVYSSNFVLAPTSTPFTVVVGAGGTGAASGSNVRGVNGSNSSFNGSVAIGGGGGATGYNYNSAPASIGGSGGGASGSGGTPNPNNGGKEAIGTAGQGFSGGAGNGEWYPGGGGGAGGAGTNNPANGGIGIQYPDISTYFWSGGGGGAGYSTSGGQGGKGGGGGGSGNNGSTGGVGLNNGTDGKGNNNAGGDAGANTGGGGGAGPIDAPNKGGNGGSGIVIIKYLGTPKAVGGTITQSGGYTIHTFTTVGSNTFTLTNGGTGGVCLGNTTVLTNTTAGGTWSSSDVTIASVDASGLVTGNTLGTCIMTYTVIEPTTNCVNTWDLSFIVSNPPTKPTITNTTIVCVGESAVVTASSTSLGQSFRWYDAATGGNLLYTGATFTTPVYTTNVSYFVEVNSYGCSSPRTEVPITKVLPTAGPTIVCVNSTITLTNPSTGGAGTWSSSNTNIATVDPNTGVVTGVGAGGNVVISYTFPTAINCPATYNVTVKAVALIGGAGITTQMQVLLVAGGGGAGTEMGGGGGGGGVIYNATFNVPAASAAYPIVVGAGGAGTPQGQRVRGSNGSNTTFYGLTALGGGGGATGHNINTAPAGNGGSGGGASGGGTPANGNGSAPGKGTTGQGFDGADGKNTWYPGGGGGAGGTGFSQPAKGGPGVQYSAISPFYWGGGGGGAGFSSDGGDGGIGGGGGGTYSLTKGGLGINNGSGGQVGNSTPGGNAGANTGGGGGGGAYYDQNNKGGDGGSGIVMIKYLGAPKATGGVITVAGGYTTHTFTTVGTTNFTLTGGTKTGVCLGGTTVLTNATAGGVWSSSDATIASVDASGLVTGNKLGTCTITYSVTEPTTNCVSSASILFLVANPPSISSVTGSVTCEGSSAVITANTTSEAPTFRWYNAATGGNLLYTGQTFTTPVFTANVSYFVEINSYGCTSTARTEVPVTAINVVVTPDNTGYNSPGICVGGSVTFTASGAVSYTWESNGAPLDAVANTYKLAVSLRKLRSAYTGPAIRLRRSSDNAELDFGFVNNDLNTAAIDTWLGTNNGYCVKFYDQSGNNNFMEPRSTSEQPLYVAVGSSMNNKPILRFTPSQTLKSTFNFSTPYTATIAARYSGNQKGRVLQANNNWLVGWYNGQKGSFHLDGWVANNVGGAAGTTPYVYTATGTGSASTAYENSVDITQNPTGGLTAPQGITINFPSENSDCEIGEIIAFSSVLSKKDRESIEQSAGAYFGIYGSLSKTDVLTVSPVSTTTYVLKATSSTGCVVRKEVTVTVNQVPTPTVLVINGERSLGLNLNTTLTNATSGGQWFSSDPTIATIDISSGVANGKKLGKTTISYVVTNSTGCTAYSTMTLGVYKPILNRNGRLTATSVVSRNGTIGGAGMTPNGERLITALDGLSSGTAAKSAADIKLNYPNSPDGVYWIDVPGYGPKQTYCLMDSKYDGGGWMLALKSTNGTTFNYNANYWTTANTLNPTDLTRNNADAKYDVMNGYLAKDLMALWPTTANISTESGSIDGLTTWSWLQNNFHNSGDRTTVLSKFNASQTTYYTSTNGTMTFIGYNSSKFSNQGGFTFYGINYTVNTNAKVRWGFAWNNETDQSSNDLSSGIGISPNYGNNSARDTNATRVEIYVR